MESGAASEGKMSRRAAFSLAGWLLLLVAVLSAIPSATAPRTRQVGSAFDPAAIAVSIKTSARIRVDAAVPLATPDRGSRPDSHHGPIDRPQWHLVATSGVRDCSAKCGRTIVAVSGLTRMRIAFAGPRAPPVLQVVS